jgi:hypothetical protein
LQEGVVDERPLSSATVDLVMAEVVFKKNAANHLDHYIHKFTNRVTLISQCIFESKPIMLNPYFSRHLVQSRKSFGLGQFMGYDLPTGKKGTSQIQKI